MIRFRQIGIVGGIVMFTMATLLAAQDFTDIDLPTPRTDGGKPLMQALKERKTSRSFSQKKLPMQMVSDLLWAAFGINRPDANKRTAPSA
jgi:hypothetical protein